MIFGEKCNKHCSWRIQHKNIAVGKSKATQTGMYGVPCLKTRNYASTRLCWAMHLTGQAQNAMMQQTVRCTSWLCWTAAKLQLGGKWLWVGEKYHCWWKKSRPVVWACEFHRVCAGPYGRSEQPIPQAVLDAQSEDDICIREDRIYLPNELVQSIVALGEANCLFNIIIAMDVL